MKCPSCPDTTLVMSERQGVEIDYCPSCRGVWLDRGELDKLLERESRVSAEPARQPTRQPDVVDSDHGKGYGAYPRRKKSWLGEIFD